MALRTCEASVIGSLRERGNAKALLGNRLTSAASSRPCSAGRGAFQVAFVPLVFLTFDGFIGLLHSVEIDVVSPNSFGTASGQFVAILSSVYRGFALRRNCKKFQGAVN